LISCQIRLDLRKSPNRVLTLDIRERKRERGLTLDPSKLTSVEESSPSPQETILAPAVAKYQTAAVSEKEKEGERRSRVSVRSGVSEEGDRERLFYLPPGPVKP
jgi:hypothetical protein